MPYFWFSPTAFKSTLTFTCPCLLRNLSSFPLYDGRPRLFSPARGGLCYSSFLLYLLLHSASTSEGFFLNHHSSYITLLKDGKTCFLSFSRIMYISLLSSCLKISYASPSFPSSQDIIFLNLILDTFCSCQVSIAPRTSWSHPYSSYTWDTLQRVICWKVFLALFPRYSSFVLIAPSCCPWCLVQCCSLCQCLADCSHLHGLACFY